MTFNPDDGTKIIEKEINAWDYMQDNLIDGLDGDNDVFLDYMTDLSNRSLKDFKKDRRQNTVAKQKT